MGVQGRCVAAKYHDDEMLSVVLLGLPWAALPSPLLGALRTFSLGVGALLDWVVFPYTPAPEHYLKASAWRKDLRRTRGGTWLPCFASARPSYLHWSQKATATMQQAIEMLEQSLQERELAGQFERLRCKGTRIYKACCVHSASKDLEPAWVARGAPGGRRSANGGQSIPPWACGKPPLLTNTRHALLFFAGTTCTLTCVCCGWEWVWPSFRTCSNTNNPDPVSVHADSAYTRSDCGLC